MTLPSATPAVAPASEPVGTWIGALEVSGVKLRLAFHIERASDGVMRATLDSLDQGASGIPIDKATFEPPTLRLELAGLGAAFEGKLDGDKLVGTWTQAAAALPLAMARVDKIGPVRRPQHPARPFPYREEEVSLSARAAPRDHSNTQRIALGGTLTLPDGKGPFPAVVFVTGSGSQDRDETLLGHKPFLVLSDALTRRGIATLRFDDRGVGSSTGSEAMTTTLDFVEDVIAELAWLAARPEIDKRAIGVIGHSEGGLIAPIVAARSNHARFIVMLAGTGMRGDQLLVAQGALIARASGEPEAAVERARADAEKLFAQVRAARTDAEADAAVRVFVDSDAAQRTARAAGAERLRARWPWMRTFLSLDPVAYLAKVRVPVLAISGELDLQVPKENLPLIEAALRRGKNPDVTAVLIPGVNHLFQHATTGAPSEYATIEETFAPEAIQLVGDWIVDRTTRLRR